MLKWLGGLGLFLVTFFFLFLFYDDRLSSQYDHLFWKAFIMISVNIYDEMKHSKIYS